MVLMSDQGVSSIAVLEEENGGLLSAVSVTDVGKVRTEAIIREIIPADFLAMLDRCSFAEQPNPLYATQTLYLINQGMTSYRM